MTSHGGHFLLVHVWLVGYLTLNLKNIVPCCYCNVVSSQQVFSDGCAR
jgi:hypothetical protein